MFNVTRRVSFAVAIALTVGWGVFFLLFLASSNTLLQAQQLQGEQVAILPPGVKISVQVDKRVYRGGDDVLLAVRNDSRWPIWIKTTVDCASDWWAVEQLQSDGETWSPVTITTQTCPAAQTERFPNHTLKTDHWTAFVPGPQIGKVMVEAPAGTYRIAMLFQKGKTITAGPWPPDGAAVAVSPQFSIQ